MGSLKFTWPASLSTGSGGGGGGGLWVAEPSDYTLVCATDFATMPGTYPATNADGYSRINDLEPSTLEPNDGTKPGEVGNIYRIHYPTSLPGGYSPSRFGWLGTWPVNTGHLWLAFTFRLSPNWDNDGGGNTNVGTKQCFWGYEGAGANGMNHFVGIDTSGRGTNRQWWHVGLQDPDEAVQTTYELTPGAWYNAEFKVAPNDPGVANGSLESWVNGTKVLNRIGDALIWASDQTNVYMNRHWWDPTYGGGSESPPVAMWMDIGTIRVRVK